MGTKSKKITLELSEHDVLRLLVLVINESRQACIPWQPYWKFLAQDIAQNIERMSSNGSQEDSRCESSCQE